MSQTPPDEVEIKVREDGPYKVTGPVRLIDAHGDPFPASDRPSIVLCRCGRSLTKPYCDASHKAGGFCARERAADSAGPGAPAPRPPGTVHGSGTTAIHAALPQARNGEPFLPGPVFAAPFHMAGEVDPDNDFYGRYANPTSALLEEAIAALELAPALTFASGMAAVAAVLFTALDPGDIVVLPSDGYFQVRALAERHLQRLGIEVRHAATGDDAIRAALPGAKLVWIETPSNPMLDVVDLPALIAEAHAAGALVAVDNSLATPMRQRPAELGADYAMAAATKQLSGHGDLLLGYVACPDPDRLAAIREWRTSTGAIPGPMEAWLAHRSLATLGVRVERQEATAAALVGMLRDRDEVGAVRWPGVGCVVSFDLPDAGRAQRFLAACELVAEATSFGGVHSSAERRARYAGEAASVPAGLVRLSVGLEDPADLLADVAQALEASA